MSRKGQKGNPKSWSVQGSRLPNQGQAAKTDKSGCNEAERPRDCCSEASCKTQAVKSGSGEFRRCVWAMRIIGTAVRIPVKKLTDQRGVYHGSTPLCFDGSIAFLCPPLQGGFPAAVLVFLARTAEGKDRCFCCHSSPLWRKITVNRCHCSSNRGSIFLGVRHRYCPCEGAFPDQDRVRAPMPEWGSMDLHVLHRRTILSNSYDACERRA